MADIPRLLASTLISLARQNPVLYLSGPRQSGKTTLVKMAFPDRPYRTCKDASTLAQAQDPVQFFGQFPDGAVLDEIQRVPPLLEHLQTVVDSQRVMGKWILTGSENIGVLKSVSESLAGRVAILHLLPFSHAELASSERRPRSLPQAILLGGYPPLFDPARSGGEPWRWLTNYIDTYVQRDVLGHLRVQDRSAFWQFLLLCARHVGCETNAQQWGKEIGKDAKTIAGWLSVLEATFVLRLVPPSHHGFGKRMSKHPKLYFYDTGLACSLLGLTDVNQVAGSQVWGHLVENWCAAEVLKARWHRGLPDGLTHWRSSDGHEVDLVLEIGNRLLPIEIKASQTAHPGLAEGLRWWRSTALKKIGVKLEAGLVIYGGDQPLDLGEQQMVPWFAIDAALKDIGL